MDEKKTVLDYQKEIMSIVNDAQERAKSLMAEVRNDKNLSTEEALKLMNTIGNISSNRHPMDIMGY